MAKAKNPITFAQEFGVKEDELLDLGVLNPTIAKDSLLFIDPLLLSESSHPEFSDAARTQFERHFETVIGLLSKSRKQEDVAWRNARRMLTFPELPGTCLGYGAAGIQGRGLTGKLTDRVLAVGKEIVDIGVDDPDLFVALALFENGIGPDKISDMATNTCFPAICSFNERVLGELKLKGERFTINRQGGRFVTNPYEKSPTPIILLPTDVLRDLPIALSWDDIGRAASESQEIRDSVNLHIGEIFAKKTKRDKERLKEQAMQSADAFNALLRSIKGVNARPYDVAQDDEGLVRWAELGAKYALNNPLSFSNQAPKSLNDLHEIVREIVGDFRHLIEHKGLNKELYRSNGKPRIESTAQNLFFAFAYAHCKANDVDVSPEIDTGNGKVDFKFSTGFQRRVLVEIKLSTNPKAVSGYSKQLEEYRKAEETMRAVYLVIDVGSMGTKQERLIDVRNDASRTGDPLSDLEFVDGIRKPSPSQR